jgi:hypothetical protein
MHMYGFCNYSCKRAPRGLHVSLILYYIECLIIRALVGLYVEMEGVKSHVISVQNASKHAENA